jgi:hypothetical protein
MALIVSTEVQIKSLIVSLLFYWQPTHFHLLKNIADLINEIFHLLQSWSYYWPNRIGGVMVSMFVSSAVDRGFDPRRVQIKDYKIGMCCFSAKHAALRRKSKDWLVRNRNNVSEWSDISTRGLLFQWASTIKIQLSVLV